MMLTHIMVGVDDIDRSKKFYDATFAALGIPPGEPDGLGRVFYSMSNARFGLTKPIDGQAASVANGGTIGFAAASKEQINAWHQAGLDAGGTSCEDPPGVREGFQAYGAYLRDPVGNKLCASCSL